MGRGRDRRATVGGVLVALAIGLALSVPAQAADPGRWVETGHSEIPVNYYQGVSSSLAGDLFFDGIRVGLYRTDSALAQQVGVANEIPAAVSNREGYNHIGDITWDGA